MLITSEVLLCQTCPLPYCRKGFEIHTMEHILLHENLITSSKSSAPWFVDKKLYINMIYMAKHSWYTHILGYKTSSVWDDIVNLISNLYLCIWSLVNTYRSWNRKTIMWQWFPIRPWRVYLINSLFICNVQACTRLIILRELRKTWMSGKLLQSWWTNWSWRSGITFLAIFMVTKIMKVNARKLFN